MRRRRWCSARRVTSSSTRTTTRSSSTTARIPTPSRSRCSATRSHHRPGWRHRSGRRPRRARDPRRRSVQERLVASIEIDDRGLIVSCPSCGQKNRLAFARLGDEGRCGKCKQPLRAPGEPFELHGVADFDRLVAGASIPIVVDYWAPWCGPCRMVAPELKKVAARQAGQMLVVKVNTDELTELGQRYNIRSIPTLAVFAGGKEVARTAGARPADQIEACVRQVP